MDDILNTLLNFLVHATPFHRLMFLWAWCLGGIILAIQASQLGEPVRRIKWTALTAQTKPYWYLLYFSEVLFFFTGAYPVFIRKMDGLLNGFEHNILNGLWLGLVGIEVLMVLGVASIFVVRSFQPAPKQKTQ